MADTNTRLISLLGLLLAAVATLAAIALPVHAGDVEETDYVPGEVAVKLVSAADLPSVAADHSLDPVPAAQFGRRPIYRLRILDGAMPPHRARDLRNDTRVVYAEPVYIGQAPEREGRSSWAIGRSEQESREQWALSAIRALEARGVTRGAGVTVAVLDTGVDHTHPLLATRLVSGFDFVDMDDFPNEEGSYGVDAAYGHGTHVAGLVALAAPDAKIMPVRVLDREGFGNIWVLAEALAYVMNPDGDSATDDGADVINLSIGVRQPTELLEDVLDLLECDDEDDETEELCAGRERQGVVVVMAGGNSGTDIPEYPAAEDAPGAIGVAASTITGTLATFSTWGSWLEVAAPGDGIVSSVPGGGYATWSGTSMAAPLVASAGALLRAAYPAMRADEIVARIIATGKPLAGEQTPAQLDMAAALGLPSPRQHVYVPVVAR